MAAPADRSSPNDVPGSDQPAGSIGRAIGLGLGGGAIVAAILVLAAELAGFSAGLIVIAYFLGRIVGTLVKVGAGPGVAATVRESIAIVISLAWVAAGQVGMWLLGQAVGGVLSLPDYLYQAFGPLVPLQFMIAMFAAWWSAR